MASPDRFLRASGSSFGSDMAFTSLSTMALPGVTALFLFLGFLFVCVLSFSFSKTEEVTP